MFRTEIVFQIWLLNKELDVHDLLVDYTYYDDVFTTNTSSSVASTRFDQRRNIGQPAGLDLIDGDSKSTTPAAVWPKTIVVRRHIVASCVTRRSEVQAD
jgi:hypothetical protein